MTLRMYADRKELPLDRVQVEISHDKVHADDCVECADNGLLAGARDDRPLRAGDHVEGDDLTDDDRAKLLMIADKCPVHRTLESASAISTRLSG